MHGIGLAPGILQRDKVAGHGMMPKDLAMFGRKGDTMVAHISPKEAKMMMKKGGKGTINPMTGLPEFAEDDGGNDDGGSFGGDGMGGDDSLGGDSLGGDMGSENADRDAGMGMADNANSLDGYGGGYADFGDGAMPGGGFHQGGMMGETTEEMASSLEDAGSIKESDSSQQPSWTDKFGKYVSGIMGAKAANVVASGLLTALGVTNPIVGLGLGIGSSIIGGKLGRGAYDRGIDPADMAELNERSTKESLTPGRDTATAMDMEAPASGVAASQAAPSQLQAASPNIQRVPQVRLGLQYQSLTGQRPRPTASTLYR